MASAEDESSGRGRPREFDPESVLDAVVQLFWTNGYEATTVADIVHVTGLSKSSLYGSFGSKDRLLEAALDRYLRGVFAQFLAEFGDSSGGLADVHRFVDAYHDWLLGDAAGRGCLAINAANELGYSSDVVRRYAAEYRETLRHALRPALERAAAANEIDPSTVDTAVEQVLGLALAASVFSRSRADSTELQTLAAATHRSIDAFRHSLVAPE